MQYWRFTRKESFICKEGLAWVLSLSIWTRTHLSITFPFGYLKQTNGGMCDDELFAVARIEVISETCIDGSIVTFLREALHSQGKRYFSDIDMKLLVQTTAVYVIPCLMVHIGWLWITIRSLWITISAFRVVDGANPQNGKRHISCCYQDIQWSRVSQAQWKEQWKNRCCKCRRFFECNLSTCFE
jgi:hypothetical protein